MKYFSFLFSVLLFGCSNLVDPQVIVDKALEKAGSNQLNHSKVEFEFRGKEYGLEQENGLYEMVRLWKDTVGVVRDEVTNNGFIRQVNGENVEVIDSMATKYTSSINSVLYFALLPFRLNDAAVMKEYLGDETIKGNLYYKVKITFQEEGGGEDHDDTFIYWFNKSTYFIDYLAYSYKTDGGGMRFREAYNSRIISGVRIADYINFKPDGEISLENIGEVYNENKLKELSRIALEKVKIELY